MICALCANLLAPANTAIADESSIRNPSATADLRQSAVRNALELHQAEQLLFRAAAAKVAPSVVTIETVGGTQPGGPAGYRRPVQPRPAVDVQNLELRES